MDGPLGEKSGRNMQKEQFELKAVRQPGM